MDRREFLSVAAALPDDWESTELHVSAEIIPHLDEYRDIVRRLDNLAFDMLAQVKTVRVPQKLFGAHAALFARVLQDLRVTWSSAVCGYTMQSWTVAASCFEAAHTMGFLAVDPARAESWCAQRPGNAG